MFEGAVPLERRPAKFHEAPINPLMVPQFGFCYGGGGRFGEGLGVSPSSGLLPTS